MAKQVNTVTKRMAINKANAQIVGVVAAATFVTIFCLFAAKAAFSQNRYQARVTTAKEKAHQQLLSNIKAFKDLEVSYKAFDNTSTNVIGGNSQGTGDNDGPNSRIVLDSLPSSYDFPALTSSLEKVLSAQSLKIASITGTDDQLNQQTNESSSDPQPVPIPFAFSVTNANYSSVTKLMAKLQQSIRPIQIDTINLTGGASNMTLTVNAHTYYQPSKSLNIKTKVVK
jgi:uncharacterized protein YpmS